MLSHHRASELSWLKQNLTALIEKDRLFWDVSDVITGIRNQDFGFWSVCLGGSGLVVTRLFLGLYASGSLYSVFYSMLTFEQAVSILFVIGFTFTCFYIILLYPLYIIHILMLFYTDLYHGFCAWMFFSWYLVLHNCFEKAMFNQIVFMFFPSRWCILQLYVIMVIKSMYNLYNNHNDV